MARIEPGDAVGLARLLVASDSRNPSLVPGARGEGEAAAALAAVLADWGMQVTLQEVAPGRPNVVARVGSGARRLLFNGHLDVVDVAGMMHEPFAATVRDGRLYGRGASDMKSGVAAMCAAAVRAATAGLDGEVVVAAVVDEEFESIGTQALVDSGVRADAAIVTEPTRLAIMPAHRGFVWIEVTTHGRAAHGSRYDLGVDAISHAGLLLAALDAFGRDALTTRTHPLLGHASVHASTISGGAGWSTYPDACVLRLERRTMPGETADAVVREIERLGADVAARQPSFRATVRATCERAPSDVATDAPIVRALAAALARHGEPARMDGMSAWTDAAILNAAGIPAICFGPGDIATAHAPEEYVRLDEIERATAILTTLAHDWSTGAWPS